MLVLAHGELLETIFPQSVRDLLESFAQAEYNRLGRPFSEADLRERAPDLDAAITTWGSPAFTPEVVAAAPRLRVIAHAAGSVKPVVSEAVFTRGIIVTTAAGVIARYVGEMALLLSLAALRHLTEHDRSLKEGGWRGRADPATDSLLGQRVGLVGFGRTAREFVRLLEPFGIELLVCDPHVSPDEIAAAGGRAASLEEVLSASRVISLHAASTPETMAMLGAAQLAMIPDGAVLVNTARGALIEMSALVAELERGRFTAALDVFDPEEPLPPDHRLRSLPNVILTPHVSGPVSTRLWEMGRQAVESVRLALGGQTPPDAVQGEQLSRMA